MDLPTLKMYTLDENMIERLGIKSNLIVAAFMCSVFILSYLDSLPAAINEAVI